MQSHIQKCWPHCFVPIHIHFLHHLRYFILIRVLSQTSEQGSKLPNLTTNMKHSDVGPLFILTWWKWFHLRLCRRAEKPLWILGSDPESVECIQSDPCSNPNWSHVLGSLTSTASHRIGVFRISSDFKCYEGSCLEPTSWQGWQRAHNFRRGTVVVKVSPQKPVPGENYCDCHRNKTNDRSSCRESALERYIQERKKRNKDLVGCHWIGSKPLSSSKLNLSRATLKQVSAKLAIKMHFQIRRQLFMCKVNSWSLWRFQHSFLKTAQDNWVRWRSGPISPSSEKSESFFQQTQNPWLGRSVYHKKAEIDGHGTQR